MTLKQTLWVKVTAFRYALAIATFVTTTLACNAQSIERQVIGSTGGYAQTANISASFTVGEAVIKTQIAGTLTLTQGFQQSDDNVVGIAEPLLDVKLTAFPNPTADKVFVQVQGATSQGFSVTVFNAMGQRVEVQISQNSLADAERYELDFSALASAQYYVLVSNAENTFSKTIQINKTK